MPVPKILHRVLVRGYDPGPESASWWKKFEALHPGWELRTWSDPVDPNDFELGRLFESCQNGAQLADLLRIEILWQHGGVYVDSDVEPLTSLDHLLDNGFFIGTENGQHVSSGVVGSVPRHPALRELIDRLLEYETLPADLGANETTGPLLYTRLFEHRDDVVVLPREVFYPYNPSYGFARDSSWPRHTVCVHHWAASWKTIAVEGREPSGTLATRARQTASRLSRNHVYPLLRRVASHVIEPVPAPATHGVYVGQNKVIVSTRDGFRMSAPADDVSLTPELLVHGWYDDGLLKFIDAVLRPGDWFVDVGANVGLFSLAAAKRVGRWGRVIAFEADPELAKMCEVNAGMNWFRNVTVVASAAGSAGGEIEFSRHPDFRMLSVAGSTDHATRGVRSGYESTVVPVEAVQERIPPGAPIRLVKIDVEGGESDVLTGMQRLIKDKMVDYIVVEAIRGNAGERWFPLLDHLHNFEIEHGATLHTLGDDGRAHRISLEEVTVIETLSQLIVDFTG